MSCKEIQALFSEYFDLVNFDGDTDDISDDSLACSIYEKVSKHLDACPICAKEYEAYAQMLTAIRNITAPEPPRGFHQGLMSHVRSQVKKQAVERRRKRRMAYRSFAVAAAASIIFAAIWLGGNFSPVNINISETPPVPQAAGGAPQMYHNVETHISADMPMAAAAPLPQYAEMFGDETFATEADGGFFDQSLPFAMAADGLPEQSFAPDGYARWSQPVESQPEVWDYNQESFPMERVFGFAPESYTQFEAEELRDEWPLSSALDSALGIIGASDPQELVTIGTTYITMSSSHTEYPIILAAAGILLLALAIAAVIFIVIHTRKKR